MVLALINSIFGDTLQILSAFRTRMEMNQFLPVQNIHLFPELVIQELFLLL